MLTIFYKIHSATTQTTESGIARTVTMQQTSGEQTNQGRMPMGNAITIDVSDKADDEFAFFEKNVGATVEVPFDIKKVNVLPKPTD